MALEALKKFADELKLTRESKTITLQQIAGKTKIDLKFLQAIEDANFDILPEIYVRAFIKEYSQTIDLNPKETLQKFDNAKSGKQEDKPAEVITHELIQHEAEPVKEQEITPQVDSIPTTPIPKAFNSEETLSVQQDIPEIKPKSGLKTNYIIGSLITVAAIITIYFSFFNGSSSEIIQVLSNPDVENTTNERFKLEKQTPTQSISEAQEPVTTVVPADDSLHLSVTITERVWIKVSSDGKVLRQGIAEADSKMNFAAKKSFSFSIGNAGRVKLYFNNKPVENVGKPGEIRNLFITSDGIRYYTISPQKNEKKSSKSN